jgi:hypothetical protein
VGEYDETAIVTWSTAPSQAALVARLPAEEVLKLAEQMGNK